MRLLVLWLAAALAIHTGAVGAAVTTAEVNSLIKSAVMDVSKEYNRKLKVLHTALNTLQGQTHTALDTLQEQMQEKIWDQKVEIASLRETIAALDERCEGPSSAATGATDQDILDSVTKRVTRMLEAHRDDLRRVTERVDYLHEQAQAELTSQVSGSRERRLQTTSGSNSVDTATLDDAALWMQATNAKMLLGPLADTNLYRSEAGTLKTDGDVVIESDLTVNGENWHLTTMLTAAENVTAGNVISLCQGKACVGYGLAKVGTFAGINAEGITDVNIINLGGTKEHGVMIYRLWNATHQSKPRLRLVKSRDPVTQAYNPILGAENPLHSSEADVSQLDAAALTDTTFIVLYRRAGSLTSTTTQGAVRLCELTDATSADPFTCHSEVKISLVAGFGFKTGTIMKLGSNGRKFAIVFEHTDMDASDEWLGTASTLIGTVDNRVISLGAPERIATYVSDHHASAINDFKHIVVGYRWQDGGDQGRVTLVDVSGSIPTTTSASVVFSTEQVRFVATTMMSTKVTCVLYRAPGSNFAARGFLVSLVQQDTQLEVMSSVPVAPGSSIDNSYAMRVTRISDGQLVFVYRNSQGKPRVVDADVVGTTIVVGTARQFIERADEVAQTYDIVSLSEGNFLLAYQDNEANVPNTGTVKILKTHGGALRTGVATGSAGVGGEVQVALEGAVHVPTGIISTANGQPIASMTPGARYYARYDGGISPSSADGVLLGRALRGSLLLLERDFAGGFDADGPGAGGGGSSAFVGEIRALSGPTVPAGWMTCDGRALSRIDFSALFAAIGTTWGDGDGTSTFNIPDLRGRTVIGEGKGTSGTDSSLTSTEAALSKATEHDLGEYDGSERFDLGKSTLSCSTGVAGSWHANYQRVTSCSISGPKFTTYTSGAQTDALLNSKGSDDASIKAKFARVNMMPYATVNYIIKV